MNSLWYIFGLMIFCIIVAIGFTIYECVNKNNYYILKSLFVIALAITFIILNTPYIQDAFEQETTTIIAEYVDYINGNSDPGTTKMYFKTSNQTWTLFGATHSRIVAKMEKGKIYEIEYFNNSKLIKTYRLIE